MSFKKWNSFSAHKQMQGMSNISQIKSKKARNSDLKNKSSLICYNCDKVGHLRSDCSDKEKTLDSNDVSVRALESSKKG